MRLFIALPLPDSVKQQLAELQQPIRGVRWQPKSKMHLTLKFLGDTDEEQLGDLTSALRKIAKPSLTLSIQGCGYFPEDGHPKVLWAGVEENQKLKELQQRIESTCTSLGFNAEDRPFKPHITLGRLKNASKSDIKTFIAEQEEFQISEIPIQEFVLYEGELKSAGAAHQKRVRFQLVD